MTKAAEAQQTVVTQLLNSLEKRRNKLRVRLIRESLKMLQSITYSLDENCNRRGKACYLESRKGSHFLNKQNVFSSSLVVELKVEAIRRTDLNKRLVIHIFIDD